MTKEINCLKLLVFLTTMVCCRLLVAETAVAENYIIGPGDAFTIKVYENPDLTTTVQVDGNGNIRFPLIGEFQAKGLSVSDLSGIIEEKLADGYIINPQVSIVMTGYSSSKATILGQVQAPALYELSGRTTLLELISKAGGLTADAGGYAVITRQSGGDDAGGNSEKETIKINLTQLIETGDTAQNILINNGDSIFISRMQKIYITGEVQRSGAYPYEEGLTVIKALTAAGGITDRASPSSIKIIRKENGKENTYGKIKMDDIVQAEDVIVVPESFF